MYKIDVDKFDEAWRTRPMNATGKAWLGHVAAGLGLRGVTELLAALLDYPDLQSFGPAKLNVFPTDPGIRELIKARDPQLKAHLEQVSIVWPVTFIAALYRVSPHWISVALLVFGIRPSTTPSYRRPPTPGMQALDALPAAERRKTMINALRARKGAYSHAAIDLGIPPCEFKKLCDKHGLTMLNWLLPPGKAAYEGGTNQASKNWAQRQGRERIREEEHRRILAELDTAGSVSEYAKRKGIAYNKGLAHAHRVKWYGITKIESDRIRAGRIIDYLHEHPNTGPEKIDFWAGIIYPDRDKIWPTDRVYARRACKLAGLRPRKIGFDVVVWEREPE